MIRVLRRRHQWIFRVLAIVLPLLLLSALWARHAPPLNERLPGNPRQVTR
jgi:hypothetical protein